MTCEDSARKTADRLANELESYNGRKRSALKSPKHSQQAQRGSFESWSDRKMSKRLARIYTADQVGVVTSLYAAAQEQQSKDTLTRAGSFREPPTAEMPVSSRSSFDALSSSGRPDTRGSRTGSFRGSPSLTSLAEES